jgi:hypothetical protein
MIEHFENITSEEFKTLTDTIARITILIGGADGTLSPEEKRDAKKLTKIRSYANAESLHGFYKKVGENFLEVLDTEYELLPGIVDDRANVLVEKIKLVNDILPKLEQPIGQELYKSYVSFAQHVAKCSGGFLDFLSVSAAEDKWMDLNMINPV